MSRGKPIKKNEENMKKELDIKFNSENLELAEVLAEKEKVEKSHIDEFEEIISPDGQFRYRRPKNVEFAEYVNNRPSKIPSYKKDGQVIIWPTDIRKSYITDLMAKGYSFVREGEEDIYDSKTGMPVYPTKEDLKISAQTRVDGKECYHYAMKTSVENHNRILAAIEKNTINQVEGSIQSTIGSPVAGASEYNPKGNALGRGNFKEKNIIGTSFPKGNLI